MGFVASSEKNVAKLPAESLLKEENKFIAGAKSEVGVELISATIALQLYVNTLAPIIIAAMRNIERVFT